MNIFFLDWNARKCAKMHCNAHVIKMILETCQLLCSAHHITNSSFCPPYRLTHPNHPCAVWVRESIHNYKWLCELGCALCDEYYYRYGKRHKSEIPIRALKFNTPPLPDNGFTIPAQAMPDEYKCISPVDAYRAYYSKEKRNIKMFSWDGKCGSREVPEWL